MDTTAAAARSSETVAKSSINTPSGERTGSSTGTTLGKAAATGASELATYVHERQRGKANLRKLLREELILGGLGLQLLLLEVTACLLPGIHLVLGVVVRLESIWLSVNETDHGY